MPTFYLPPQPPIRPRQADLNDVAGADVAFTTGMVIEAGDWKMVTGEDAAKQSVIRETIANVGGLANRPDWGVGASDAVFRNMTQSTIDALASKARDRMSKNPRVARVINVSSQRMQAAQGTALLLQFVPAGKTAATSVTLKPRR